MNTLWIMNPTMTNRRHFFLIESSENNVSQIKAAFISAGFQGDNLADSSFSTESTQVILRKSPSNVDSSYVGGFIVPNDKVIENAKAKDRLLGFFGKLFLQSFMVYVAMWIAAFMIVLTGITFLLQLLGLAIFFMYFIFLVLGVLTSGSFFYLDLIVAKQNQKQVECTYEYLLPYLQNNLNVQIQKLTISTKLGNRRIKAYLPEKIVTRIEQLDFGLIDAYFWNYG